MSSKNLEELVLEYVKAKTESDKLKKQVDALNAEIKSLMDEENLDVFVSGTTKISKVVQKRQSLNEDRLIPLAHEFGYNDIVKTKEYIDTDELERRIYNETLENSFLDELERCINIKEVVTLRVGKVRAGEDE